MKEKERKKKGRMKEEIKAGRKERMKEGKN